MDSAGNLYGTTYAGGAYAYGSVFRLSPSGGSWTYASLHDFTGGNDGANPFGSVTFDAVGNLYGTTLDGGAYNKGVVWEITPYCSLGCAKKRDSEQGYIQKASRCDSWR
jgi:uncharacterized repeat protein (TIGR03803 family)